MEGWVQAAEGRAIVEHLLRDYACYHGVDDASSADERDYG